MDFITLSHLLLKFLGTWVFVTIIYGLIKLIRTAPLSVNRLLNLDDLKILTGYAIIITSVSFINFLPVQIFFAALLIIWWVLLWIDAIIFYLFAFEINLKSITYFFHKPERPTRLRIYAQQLMAINS
jgi:hypothetical protein